MYINFFFFYSPTCLHMYVVYIYIYAYIKFDAFVFVSKVLENFHNQKNKNKNLIAFGMSNESFCIYTYMHSFVAE